MVSMGDASKNLPLFELARVLVRLDHIAHIIANAATVLCERL